MGNVRQLRVRGKTAFLTTRQCGLWAVDVSDETNPKIISNFDAVEMATGLDVVGDVAFAPWRLTAISLMRRMSGTALKSTNSASKA